MAFKSSSIGNPINSISGTTNQIAVSTDANSNSTVSLPFTIDLTGKSVTNGSYTPMSMQISDSSFSFTNGGNNTQTAKFSAANITTPRTFTFPNGSGTLALTSGTIASVSGTANQISASTDANGNTTVGFVSNMNIPTTVSIGTTSLYAQLQINGGIQNQSNEQSALRIKSTLNTVTSVKMELDCTPASTATGALFEIRSNSSGTFDVVNRTKSIESFIIDANNNTQVVGNLGVGGVPSTVYGLDVQSAARMTRLVGNSLTPGAIVNSAAGSGATCTITGTELSGIITLKTGTATTTGTVVNFGLASPMSNIYYSVIIEPANAAAVMAKTTLGVYMSNVSTSTSLMIASLMPLAASTTYLFSYNVIGS